MDIHESFEYKLKEFNELVKKINEKSDDDNEYTSQWEHFENFLRDLLNDNNDRFRSAILRLFFDEETELHDKMKYLFNILTDFEDKKLVSMIYNSGCDKVNIEFDKIEDDII